MTNDKNQRKSPADEGAHHEPVEGNSHKDGDDKRSDKEKGNHEFNPKTEGHPNKPPLSVGVLIFTLLNLCGFVFCAAGISIGMMNNRENESCISIWGYKPKCSGTWFRASRPMELDGVEVVCNKKESLVNGAQAFSVMSLIGGFLTTVTAFMELFHVAELAVVVAIMSFINMVAVLVVWSTMLAMYWANLCGRGVYADEYRIGDGLILYITAWCCQMVANITIVVTVALGQAK